MKAVYSTELATETARAALAGVSPGTVDSIVFEEVRSPWEERVRLHSRKNHTEAVFCIWKSPAFLSARIHRLALYILDSLDPVFQYDRDAAAALSAVPQIRQDHNHIWSIYVDSRIERMGLENFFDRALRRNLFVDGRKGYPWSLSIMIFEKLWEKEHFTHPEIMAYARNPEKALKDVAVMDLDAFEVEINRCGGSGSVKDHITNMPSPQLRDVAHRLLAFLAESCDGARVDACCYGMRLISEGEVFAEMVVSRRDSILITLFGFESDHRVTYALGTDPLDMERIQTKIKETYDAISRHSHARRLTEPLRVPI